LIINLLTCKLDSDEIDLVETNSISQGIWKNEFINNRQFCKLKTVYSLKISHNFYKVIISNLNSIFIIDLLSCFPYYLVLSF